MTISKAVNEMSGGDIVHIVGPGMWEERIIPSHSGKEGSFTTFIGEDGAQVRGVYINGLDYIRIVGIEVTNVGSSFDNHGIELYNANYCEILDCYLHDLLRGGIRQPYNGPGSFNTFRNNRIVRTGVRGDRQTDGAAGMYIWGTNNLCEYNDISRVSDFFSTIGKENIFRNNYLHDIQTSYFGGENPHVDFIEQSPVDGGLDLVRNVFERNYCENNNVIHGHGILSRNTSSRQLNYGTIYRFNVLDHLGSYAAIVQTPQFKYYNNTIAYANEMGANEAVISIAWINGNDIMHCSSMNNIIYKSNNMGVRIYYSGYAPADFSPDYDLIYGSAVIGIAEPNLQVGDPNFVNYEGHDLHLKSYSIARDNAGPQTNAVGSGSLSNKLMVVDPYFFHDGYEIVKGDVISIGSGSKVKITDIDYYTGVLTLESPRSWNDGDKIILEGTNDIGAFPFKSEGYSYNVQLTEPTDSQTIIGNTILRARIDNPRVVRYVEFLVDGLPVDRISPGSYVSTSYTFNGTESSIEARAYPLYADRKLVDVSKIKINTSLEPASPTNLRVAPRIIGTDN